MHRHLARVAIVSALLALTAGPAVALPPPNQSISLDLIGRYETGIFDGSAAEIVAHDPETQRLFVVNAAAARIDVLDASDPTDPVALDPIDVAAFGAFANSVDVDGGVVAIAVEAQVKTDPGTVVFTDAAGTVLATAIVGALPDMLTFTPDGKRVIVANEGEPNDDYSVDPEGSVSIIELSRRAGDLSVSEVRTVNFTDFNEGAPRHRELDPDIRIFGPGASVAQDLEPEYIALSHDGRTAWVALQENNALAIIDVRTGTVSELVALGFKDHSLAGNGLDPSDRDGAIAIENWPVLGMRMPDGIAAYRSRGQSYIITANEGDARDYAAYSEEARVEDLDLGPAIFSEGTADEDQLGRLTVTTANGDTDGDGVFEELYAFGARSFSIWSADGTLVFDSDDDFEQITADQLPDDFNANNDENDTFDNRSDNKGPEPEGVAVGEVRGRTFAFIGLERIGGVMVYDVTNPRAPSFVQYINPRDFDGDVEASTAGDLGPEGLTFIPAHQSPNGEPLLVVANEVSGSTAIYSVTAVGPGGGR